MRASLLLLGILPVPCFGQLSSPVGTWDIVFKGPYRQGIAYVTFLNDGTFDGMEVMVPTHPNPSFDSRGGDVIGRSPSGGTNSVGTGIYGTQEVTGPWGFDGNGRVIGYWIEIAEGTVCTSNQVVQSVTTTNNGVVTTTITTNMVQTCNSLTNQVSFVGKVVPGKRLSLVASTSTGKVTYRGVPYQMLPDVSGNWYGVKKANGQNYLEFFNMTNSTVFPNIYTIGNGNGPGYTYEGLAIISAQKQIGFSTTVVYPTVATNGFAAIGPFNPRRIRANAPLGLEGLVGTGATNRISFQAGHQ